MEEKGISASDVHGSGRRGQVLKEDVIAASRDAQTGGTGWRTRRGRGLRVPDAACARAGDADAGARRSPTMPPARSACA